MFFDGGTEGGHGRGGCGGQGGSFLKNHTSTIWSVKSAAKKLKKTILPQTKGRKCFQFLFFFLPRVCENHEI